MTRPFGETHRVKVVAYPTSPLLVLVTIMLLLVFGGTARCQAAQIFLAQDEALERAFPEADRWEKKTVVLSAEQVQTVQKISQERLTKKIVQVNLAFKAGALLGYAYIDTAIVRTNYATSLIKMSPSGEVLDVFMLAFYEPREYLPTDRWYTQFRGHDNPATLNIDREIAGIMGSTLSVRAINGGVKRAMAICSVIFKCGASR